MDICQLVLLLYSQKHLLFYYEIVIIKYVSFTHTSSRKKKCFKGQEQKAYELSFVELRFNCIGKMNSIACCRCCWRIIINWIKTQVLVVTWTITTYWNGRFISKISKSKIVHTLKFIKLKNIRDLFPASPADWTSRSLLIVSRTLIAIVSSSRIACLCTTIVGT